MAAKHSISENKVFEDWRPLLALPKMADFAIVATQDQQHRDPAVALAKLGCALRLAFVSCLQASCMKTGG
jgi:predicted dehydrogenase